MAASTARRFISRSGMPTPPSPAPARCRSFLPGSSDAPAATISGIRCSAVGWAARPPGASAHRASRSARAAPGCISVHVSQKSNAFDMGVTRLSPNPLRSWKLIPEPTISTPSSRNGASARPAAMWSAGSKPRSTDISTTGIVASGKATFKGMKTPWSNPRSGSSSTGTPAAPSSAAARTASSGAAGVSYRISYVAGGKP